MRRHYRICLLILMYVLVFSLSLFVFTQNNQLPTVLHPDEPGKVGQVLAGKYRFTHPLLMINTIRAACAVLNTWQPNEVAIIGRWVSASFAALSVICLMGLGHMLRSWKVGLGVGILNALNPTLLLNAHYIKEETALIFGMSLSALAYLYHHRNPSTLRLALLGASCAVVMSAKYVGVVVLPWIILPMILPRLEPILENRSRKICIFIAVLIFVLCLINIHGILNSHTFVTALKDETNHVTSNHKGLWMLPFSSFYPRKLVSFIPLSFLILPLAVYYVFNTLRSWKDKAKRIEVWLLLWPLSYFIVVGAIPVQLERYLLPIICWIMLLAVMGFDMAITDIRRYFPVININLSLSRFAASITLLFAAVLSIPNYLRCRAYLDQFVNESRINVDKWISLNLPRDTKILADMYVRLNVDKSTGKTKPSPPRISSTQFAGALGSAEAIRRAGYDYVVVCSHAYERIFDPSTRFDTKGFHKPSAQSQKTTGLPPKILNSERFTRIRRGYEEIFQQFQLVWSQVPDPDMGGYTNPEVRVYRVTPSGNNNLPLDTNGVEP